MSDAAETLRDLLDPQTDEERKALGQLTHIYLVDPSVLKLLADMVSRALHDALRDGAQMGREEVLRAAAAVIHEVGTSDGQVSAAVDVLTFSGRYGKEKS